jgi:hypothetical protein
MEAILNKLTLASPYVENDSFEHYIAISSDSLLIIDGDLELVEWIIEGDSTDGVYMTADTLDDFLDAIIVLKRMILSGVNPFDHI